MSESLARAQALLAVKRPLDAARELGLLLAHEPERADAHALLAAALLAAGRGEEALASARRAVGLAPEVAHHHRMLGWVLCHLEREKEGLASARRALELDADEVGAHALEASCLSGLARWNEMLASAERGLALAPTDVVCIQLRAHALRMLGRTDAAAEALDVALAEAPDDADTHCAYGFTRLQSGDLHAALGHFREALRLEPSHESARRGLVEALKARSPLYRPFLWWLMFAGRCGHGRALFLMCALIWGGRAVGRVLQQAPGFAVLGGGIVVACALLVWTSWVGAPLFDLLIWLRRDTRELLAPRDRRVALAVGVAVLAAALAGALLAYTAAPIAGAMAAMAFLLTSMMVVGAASSRSSMAHRFGIAAVIIASLLALAGTAITAVEGAPAKIAENRYEHSLGFALMGVSMLIGALFTWALTVASFWKARR